MAIVDLRGIHYRSYVPQWNEGAGDEEYDPTTPGDADITPGGVDLGIIKYRAWEENELEDGE
jgi:hypothetical protein